MSSIIRGLSGVVAVALCGGLLLPNSALSVEPLVSSFIDIKPGSCPNPLNLRDRGVIPVGIVGTDSFDPTTEVVPESVTLAGVPALKWEILDTTQPDSGAPTDCLDCFDADLALNCDLDGDGINDAYCGDGIPDLIVYFDAQALVAALGEVADGDCVELMLAAELVDGQETSGSDWVLIRRKGRSNW